MKFALSSSLLALLLVGSSAVQVQAAHLKQATRAQIVARHQNVAVARAAPSPSAVFVAPSRGQGSSSHHGNQHGHHDEHH